MKKSANADATQKDPRRNNERIIRSPRGTVLSAKSWLTEAPLRMLMNNLDPEVAERPNELVVYGGIGRAARNWEAFDRIVEALRQLEADETLLVQSGKPVGVFRTHADAPRVLIANSNLVPHWATWEHFRSRYSVFSRFSMQLGRHSTVRQEASAASSRFSDMRRVRECPICRRDDGGVSALFALSQ